MHGQEFRWRNNWNQALLEVARIARDKVIGLAQGSGHCLNGVFKVKPAERQCLLQNQMLNRLDVE